MRICIATNSLLPADKEGGPAHSSLYLAKALQAAGAEVRVVTTDRNGPERLRLPLDQWVEREGVMAFYAATLPGAWIRSPTYRDAINAAVAASDVCLMSGIFWNYTGFAAARACGRHCVPYLTFPRGLLSPWALRHKGLKKRVYWYILARRILEGSAALIALAQQELQDIRTVGLKTPAYVIPNGAFVEKVLEAEEPEENPSTENTGPRYVLFLGRVHAKKGLDILLSAFEHVARLDPTISLIIAGSVDPAYACAFDELLFRNSARDRVRLVGNVSGRSKARLLSGASVFVLTSHSEGLPVAVLEALSIGLPVIITPGCNLPEVAAAEAGIEVEPNVESTAEALVRLIGDPALRRKMGFNAKRLAKESFGWDSIARKVLEVCLSVTKEGRALQTWKPEVKNDATSR